MKPHETLTWNFLQYNLPLTVLPSMGRTPIQRRLRGTS
jgi:hypothetical protein